MAAITWEVVDGKARFNGQTLLEWAPTAAANIAAALHPVRIILFGSAARGEDGSDSDLDLLIVLDELASADRHSVTVQARLAAGVPAPMDIVVADVHEIAERGEAPGLLRVALREGKALYERP